ncbi:MAG: CRISPR-associated helicase Cas3' [candidate division KSB1 bacterium]|nr:CRISPR-associated helicase Cas3' [candidate division KSB1 bacterium]
MIDHQLFSGDIAAFLKRVDAGLRIACATHDIGKLNQGFHLFMAAERERQTGKKVNVKAEWHFRHELLSLPYTYQLSLSLAKVMGNLPGNLPWETVAVMGHHKRLDNDIFKRERERRFIPASPILEPALLQQLAWDWLNDYLPPEVQSFNSLPPKFWSESVQLLQHGQTGRYIQVKNQISEAIQNQRRLELRFLLRFFGASFKAHLQICDWWASAERHEIFGLGKHAASPIHLQQQPEDWLREKLENAKRSSLSGNPPEIQWREFQLQVASTGNYINCIAPTGSGKTEAALLWALNRIRSQPHLSKILYLLPTTTTANAIHQRLSDLFGKSMVGVAHSKAKLLREDDQEEAEEDRGEVRQSVLFESAFFPPITVATLDQLLLAGQHGKYWVFRNHSLAQSAVILDELHAFDPYTLGLLGAFAQQLRLLKIPALALSATFPKPLQDLFQSWFTDVELVQDTTLLEASRSQWQFLTNTTFEDQNFLREISRRMRKGERFLIVRNTVRGAQETFKELQKLKAPVRLLHSNFIQKDRKAIEDAIFEEEESHGKTSLVATQIVEVSLDIDYDHLITELCPPDALVQRAGRCNRRRTKKAATVTVLAADEISHKVYREKFGISNLLKQSAETLSHRLSTPQQLTESDLLDWVNEVYQGTNIADEEKYQQAKREFSERQRRLGYILDHPTEDERLETRWIKEERVPVIPKDLWYNSFDEEMQRSFFHDPVQRARYVVEIPFWRRKQLYAEGKAMPVEYQGKKLEFLYWVEVPYDNIIGLQLPKPDKAHIAYTEFF